jgi:hypothetical protein
MEETPHVRWWAVRVLFEQVIGDESSRMVRDSIFLVLAGSERGAATTGEEFASAENFDYPNAFGESVRVHFDQVTDVHEIGETDLGDGTEFYMSLEAASDAESLRSGDGRGRSQPAQAISPRF